MDIKHCWYHFSNIKLSLGEGTPSWIQLFPNNTLFLETASQSLQIDNQTQITLILTDETDAYSKYHINITVDSISKVVFPQIKNFTLNWSSLIDIYLGINSSSDINIKTCDESIDPAAKYFKDNSTLELSFNSNEVWISKWYKLESIDQWSRKIYSDEFWIKFESYKPPVITNSFGPLSVNKGVLKLFDIPLDLFTDPQYSNLTLSNTNWIDRDIKNTIIEIRAYKTQSINYLYVLTEDSFFSWSFIIFAQNIYGLTSEYAILLNVIQCSSKTWAECVGPYQSDWRKWNKGYELQSDGVWLWKSSTISFKDLTFYSTWGLIVYVIILTQLILAIKLKYLSLYPLFYSQKILIVMLSIKTFDQELASFASFFEWTKLDLGFLYFGIQEKVGWKQQSEKLMKAQFYCETTIQNYMFLILIVVLVFMFKFLILKKWIKNENSKISMLLIKISSVWSYSTFLLMIYNLFQFFLSNILIDLMNFNNHILLSFI